MPRVTIDNRIIIAEVGTTLSRLLPGLEQPCSGKGICGKCKVRAEGALSPLTPQEQRHLTVFDLADGLRLACCATVQGDCRVERLDASPVAVVTRSVPGAYGTSTSAWHSDVVTLATSSPLSCSSTGPFGA